jgi:hypothetical protein
MEIYKSLHDGNSEEFDLCCDGDRISFEYNSNYTISTRSKFTRTLKFEKQLKDTYISKQTATVESELIILFTCGVLMTAIKLMSAELKKMKREKKDTYNLTIILMTLNITKSYMKL